MNTTGNRPGSLNSDPHQPDRLFRGASAGTRNPRDRDTDVSTHSAAHPRRHLQSHLFADRAEGHHVVLADSKGVAFHIVVIGDHSTPENIARSGHAGDPFTKHAASAAF